MCPAFYHLLFFRYARSVVRFPSFRSFSRKLMSSETCRSFSVHEFVQLADTTLVTLWIAHTAYLHHCVPGAPSSPIPNSCDFQGSPVLMLNTNVSGVSPLYITTLKHPMRLIARYTELPNKLGRIYFYEDESNVSATRNLSLRFLGGTKSSPHHSNLRLGCFILRYGFALVLRLPSLNAGDLHGIRTYL